MDSLHVLQTAEKITANEANKDECARMNRKPTHLASTDSPIETSPLSRLLPGEGQGEGFFYSRPYNTDH